jgi:large subunit ribosomal protein L17
MRHKKGFNHLSRKSNHRKAMLSNMASSLIVHKRISTTVAKAKALKQYVEPLITKSKDDTTHSRRIVFSYLQDKAAVTELFREFSPKIADRPGGYTRILKTGARLGDNADMCIVELVDYNENLLESAKQKTKSTRRRRGSGKAKTEIAQKQTVAEEQSPELTAEKEDEVQDVVDNKEEVVEAKETEAKVEETTENVQEEKDETSEEAKVEEEKDETKAVKTPEVEELKEEKEKEKSGDTAEEEIKQ